MNREAGFAVLPLSVPEWILESDPNAGMVRLPAGEYLMGDGIGGGFPQELPVHRVEVNEFWLGRCCVTAAEYLDFIRDAEVFEETWVDFIDPCFIVKDGSGYCLATGAGPYPMIQVSFVGATAFCNWKSEKFNLKPVYCCNSLSANLNANGFRLPTEIEWEWAAGGRNRRKHGDSDEFSTDRFSHRNYNGPLQRLRASDLRIGGFGLYPQGPLPVGTLPANDFGLHEMLGNVNEWCHDCYYPYRSDRAATIELRPNSFRVLRGGSFLDDQSRLRPSYRHGIHCHSKCMIDGFRIARNCR